VSATFRSAAVAAAKERRVEERLDEAERTAAALWSRVASTAEDSTAAGAMVAHSNINIKNERRAIQSIQGTHLIHVFEI